MKLMNNYGEDFCENCYFCGSCDSTVHERIDPYNYEIDGTYVFRQLCEKCYSDRVDDI